MKRKHFGTAKHQPALRAIPPVPIHRNVMAPVLKTNVWTVKRMTPKPVIVASEIFVVIIIFPLRNVTNPNNDAPQIAGNNPTNAVTAIVLIRAVLPSE